MSNVVPPEEIDRNQEYCYTPFACKALHVFECTDTYQKIRMCRSNERGRNVSDVFERVQGIIVEQLGVSDDEVKSEASFRENLEADSLDLVELIMAFEEEFGGEISDDEAQKIQTVGQAVTYIEQNMI